MAPKLESFYKTQMVKEVKKAGGYGRRIEDQYGVGILDLVFKLPDTEVIFAEAKRFTGHQFALSPRQWEEGRRVVAAGGIVASIGIRITNPERIYIFGLPKDKNGVVYAEDCVAQQPGEDFIALLRRWYGEENDRREAADKRREHPVQREGRSDDAAGEPARWGGRQLPDDWKFVE
jgi:hypothetical protein